MALGSVFRRCSCRGSDGKELGTSCPKLKRSGHGQWSYRIELPADAGGARRPRRRAGFDSATEAQAELDHARELLALPKPGAVEALRRVGDAIATAIKAKRALPPVDQIRQLLKANLPVLVHPTLEEWLLQWLPGRKRLARNTYRSYESHIRLYLIPYLGGLRINEIRVAHVGDMFEQIAEHNDEITNARASKDQARIAAVRYQRPVGVTSMQRIRETLRKSLNDAIRAELITFNPAKWVEMPPSDRPKPMIWTPERIEHWLETGEVPSPVMVWTPDLTGLFLDHIAQHRLYALFHLIAHVGLRRGEGCGLRKVDTHLRAGTIDVLNQIVQYGWETGHARPKTDDSAATVALDAGTVLVLQLHLAQQAADKQATRDAWVETGLVFTDVDGSALHPADVTALFQFLTRQAGLPPIRLHDLRHGAATTALAAGVEMKIVQTMLRHASITTTSNLYTNVLTQVARDAAEKTALIIPRASARLLGPSSGPQQTTVDTHQDSCETANPQVNVEVDLGICGAPPGTRTPNPLVKSQLLCQLS
ncbi:site-specific integrase [Actinokineospora sp. NBRC 105648]|nr:site-specific integrase [Actinokineospora sp. NBRC 105648]